MTMQSIGMALVHSVWEGGIIAALLALAFSVTRKSRPSVRYALGMAGLVAMIIVPIATVARSNPAVKFSAVSTAPASPDQTAIAVDQTKSPVAAPAAPSNEQLTPTRGSVAVESIMTKLAPSLPWLVVLWLIGLVFLSARMIYGVAATRRITRQARPSSAKLAETVSRIAAALRIQRVVTSLEGTHVTVPMVVGWIRPVIIAPSSLVTGLTASQLDMLVAHELAHIRRYDYLANMAQTVIETLLFFHPAAWWLSERIREERENCCDDIAVSVSGNDRKAYTAALLALEESRDDFVFAAAATGGTDRGSLLRRAMRLLSGGPAHLDLGARWIAGVITIFAALFTTGPAVGKAADIPIAAKLDVISMLSPAPDTVEREKYASDASRSAPDTVLIYNGNGSLRQRWEWAQDRARSLRTNRYWIGYLVSGDGTSQLVYQDSDVPVRSGNSSFMGRMRIGDARNLIFTGSQLAPRFGAHSSRSSAVFLQFERGSGKLTRVHMGSYGLPVYFDRAAAFWLDSASDVESIAQLRAIASAEQSSRKRRDLISMIGMHRDVNAMLPPLVEIIDSPNEADAIRQEAVEAVGSIPDPRAYAILSRVARHDRSTKTREEAIESFQNMRSPAVTDTLIAMATTIDDSRLRRVAIESLGELGDDRAAAFLINVAKTSTDNAARREAVEALGNMNEIGFKALADLARHGDTWVREEAVEEIVNTDASKRVLDLILEVARSDPSESVRAKAVETLGEINGSEAMAALRSIALNDASDRLRREALETYSDHAVTETAVSLLKGVIANDRSYSMRLHALELLIDLDRDAVREMARTTSDARIRREALENLSER